MKHLFIINPISFYSSYTVDSFAETIENYFKNLPSTISNEKVSVPSISWSLYITKYPRDAIAAIKETRAKLDADETLRVYAAGGSGILYDCLNGIVDEKKIELASLPFGLSNSFFRSFGPNLSAFKDIQAQTTANATSIDCFKCNVNYAVNACSVGIEGAAREKTIKFYKTFGIVHKIFPHSLSFIFSIYCYFSILNKNIREQLYEITIDGEDYSGCYANIFIANGRYHALNHITLPQANPKDGYLDVLLCKSSSILRLALAWHLHQNGKYALKPSIFTMVRAKKILIKSHGYPEHVYLDSEFFKETRLDIEIMENALQFVDPSGLTNEAGVT